MYNPNRADEFADRWLGRRVRFKLLSQQVEGEVREVIDHVCTGSNFLVVEFWDSGKQVKVGAPWQAFRRLPDAE